MSIASLRQTFGSYWAALFRFLFMGSITYTDGAVLVKPKYSSFLSRNGILVGNAAKAIRSDVSDYRWIFNNTTRILLHNNQQLYKFKTELQQLLENTVGYPESAIERNLGFLLSKYSSDVNDPSKPVPSVTLVKSLSNIIDCFLGYPNQHLVIGSYRNRYFNYDSTPIRGDWTSINAERFGTKHELSLCHKEITELEESIRSIQILLHEGVDTSHPIIKRTLKAYPEFEQCVFFFRPNYELYNSDLCPLLLERLVHLRSAVSYFERKLSTIPT